VPGIIEVRGLVKVYETGGLRVEALQGVDLDIERGQMVAIMGPSGCGKTTLLNTLSGIDDITTGEVIIDGASIHDMPDKERTRYRAESMGFIFQSFNLLPVLSGVENVELPLLLAGMPQKVARRKALETLELVGLVDQANKRPAEMSGGQQQRITVARAIVNDPAIIWADEPTGALDSETSKEIMDLLCDLNERKHQTFVLVTHDNGVGARAERLVRMRDGRIESDEATPNGGAV
jgi:ABC-type lipoprotein export system ATPase subunit